MAHHVQTAAARKDFADLIDRSAGGERIKITRYRNTLAVIVSKRDLEKLEACEESERAAGSSEAKVAREGCAEAPPPARRHRRR